MRADVISRLDQPDESFSCGDTLSRLIGVHVCHRRPGEGGRCDSLLRQKAECSRLLTVCERRGGAFSTHASVHITDTVGLSQECGKLVPCNVRETALYGWSGPMQCVEASINGMKNNARYLIIENAHRNTYLQVLISIYEKWSVKHEFFFSIWNLLDWKTKWAKQSIFLRDCYNILARLLSSNWFG
jgi:hypothetical protein